MMMMMMMVVVVVVVPREIFHVIPSFRCSKKTPTILHFSLFSN